MPPCQTPLLAPFRCHFFRFERPPCTPRFPTRGGSRAAGALPRRSAASNAKSATGERWQATMPIEFCVPSADLQPGGSVTAAARLSADAARRCSARCACRQRSACRDVTFCEDEERYPSLEGNRYRGENTTCSYGQTVCVVGAQFMPIRQSAQTHATFFCRGHMSRYARCSRRQPALMFFYRTPRVGTQHKQHA